ncbi:MAG: hypothetical protein M3540_09725 [Actinomycetota bacterium]|nr:hypothetical protein [Actinomycetota bacterium]
MNDRRRKLSVVVGLIEIAIGLDALIRSRQAYGLGFIAAGVLFIALGRTRWLSAKDGREL